MNVALITGASSGIGYSFAEQLDGYELDEIWIIARRKNNLNELAKSLKTPARIFVADLATDSGVQSIIDALAEYQPSIKFLINNAGFGKVGTVKNMSRIDTHDMIALQVEALTWLTQSSLPYMRSGSSIILVSSLASFVSMPGFATYAAVKSYITSFGIALYQELKSEGIHVCTVCPGPVKTEFGERSQFELKTKKESVFASDITQRALKDCIRKRPYSLYGAMPRMTRILLKIFGNRISSRIVQRYMFREMEKQHLS